MPRKEETKEKIRQSNLGKQNTKYQIEKQKKSAIEGGGNIRTGLAAKNHHSLPAIQFDLNGKYIKEWESAKEASEILKIQRTCINKCRNKQRKTAGGFIWKHKEV